jgi:hypothetical protein
VLFAIYAPPGRDRFVVRPGNQGAWSLEAFVWRRYAAVNDIHDNTGRK